MGTGYGMLSLKMMVSIISQLTIFGKILVNIGQMVCIPGEFYFIITLITQATLFVKIGIEQG